MAALHCRYANIFLAAWITGVVVMGRISCKRGHEFESRVLNGNFVTLICCKTCHVCLKKTENK